MQTTRLLVLFALVSSPSAQELIKTEIIDLPVLAVHGEVALVTGPVAQVYRRNGSDWLHDGDLLRAGSTVLLRRSRRLPAATTTRTVRSIATSTSLPARVRGIFISGSFHPWMEAIGPGS